MKKFYIILIMVCCCIYPCSVYGDLEPKPSLTIVAENMPDSNCYLDLLINYKPENVHENIRWKSKYDQRIFGVLERYNVEGWRPAMVTGTSTPIFGDIVCDIENGRCKLRFTYIGVPDRFKVIVVSANGETVVSNSIRRTAFNSNAKFNYKTGVLTESSPLWVYVLQFIITCLVTLSLEGVALLLFNFSLKLNWKPFLLINTSTQTILAFLVFYQMFYNGILKAITVYALFEIIIVISEAILFSRLLIEHTKLKRILFSIFANVLSFIAGFIALLIPLMYT